MMHFCFFFFGKDQYLSTTAVLRFKATVCGKLWRNVICRYYSKKAFSSSEAAALLRSNTARRCDGDGGHLSINSILWFNAVVDGRNPRNGRYRYHIVVVCS